MGANPEVHACPKCGRILFQSGEAVVDDRVLGVGRGGSKKIAEQEAAREALLREREVD